ncbi:MAG: carbamoyl-phosphate synthase L chain ATP-binding protein, partial [Actinomycetota bacterium]
ILIKAAAGGGGKGMRIVMVADELDEAVAAAKREAASGFGDDRVFAERYVTRARHIEIQVMGDADGNVVHLGERECSIQRRHQKIIEEAPSPFVSPELRAAMGKAAVDLAASLDYRSAGTVEFLVDDDGGDYYFLEVNTRLQVEHPVTEAVTGRDLVRDQLLVAMGQPLDVQPSPDQPTRHAIEARLYAEDPANDFLPSIGTLTAFEPSSDPELRWDTGVEQGSVIGVDFDPMIAKAIAHGPTRAEAAGRLALGLERLHVGGSGGLVTNRDFLVSVLRSPAFLAGDTTTDFIERVAPAPQRQLSPLQEGDLAVASALWLAGANRAEAEVLGTIPAGYLIGRLPPEVVELGRGEQRVSVRYRVGRDGSFAYGLDGIDGDGDGVPAWPSGRAIVHRWSPTDIDVEVDRRPSTS